MYETPPAVEDLPVPMDEPPAHAMDADLTLYWPAVRSCWEPS